MIQVAIIEDEQLACKRLREMIQECHNSIEVVAELESVSQSIEWFATHPHPHIVFLDIHLADGNCFAIFEKIAITSYIIFTTAYDEYALKAFELQSIDYLLKPIRKEQLQKSFDKFKNMVDIQGSKQFEKMFEHVITPQYKDRFVIHIGNKIYSVSSVDIVCFFIEDRYTNICTASGKVYPIDFSLERIEELVNPTDFFRVNRQVIVNYKAIQGIEKQSKNRHNLKLSQMPIPVIAVSSHRISAFKQWLSR